MSLQESAFRLPAEREVALFQIAQIVAQDVRQTGRASNLWVTLSVDPPSALLLVEHDGVAGSTANDLAEMGGVLGKLGGRLAVEPRPGGGLRVEAVFEGDDDEDQRAAGR
jgi:nitrate/nitrite-specific signal transduction histidine kinase